MVYNGAVAASSLRHIFPEKIQSKVINIVGNFIRVFLSLIINYL